MAIKNEAQWYRKFHKGTLLIKGWQARADELLQVVPPAHQKTMAQRLAVLGEKIGREWARDNTRRRIDTAMLQKWGEELRQAKNKGHAALDETVHSLDAQIDKLLSDLV
jgi:hypothetical protein